MAPNVTVRGPDGGREQGKDFLLLGIVCGHDALPVVRERRPEGRAAPSPYGLGKRLPFDC